MSETQKYQHYLKEHNYLYSTTYDFYEKYKAVQTLPEQAQSYAGTLFSELLESFFRAALKDKYYLSVSRLVYHKFQTSEDKTNEYTFLDLFTQTDIFHFFKRHTQKSNYELGARFSRFICDYQYQHNIDRNQAQTQLQEQLGGFDLFDIETTDKFARNEFLYDFLRRPVSSSVYSHLAKQNVEWLSKEKTLIDTYWNKKFLAEQEFLILALLFKNGQTPTHFSYTDFCQHLGPYTQQIKKKTDNATVQLNSLLEIFSKIKFSLVDIKNFDTPVFAKFLKQCSSIGQDRILYALLQIPLLQQDKAYLSRIKKDFFLKIAPLQTLEVSSFMGHPSFLTLSPPDFVEASNALFLHYSPTYPVKANKLPLYYMSLNQLWNDEKFQLILDKIEASSGAVSEKLQLIESWRAHIITSFQRILTPTSTAPLELKDFEAAKQQVVERYKDHPLCVNLQRLSVLREKIMLENTIYISTPSSLAGSGIVEQKKNNFKI